MKINKTYTLRFIKLPPATIVLGKPFDIIFSLTDDLGLEVPAFPDIRVAFRVGHLEGKASKYSATETATNSSSVVVNSYRGLLHKVSLRIEGALPANRPQISDVYLKLVLIEQLEDTAAHVVDPLDKTLMEFTQLQSLLNLPDDDVLALVVPTNAGPLKLQGSSKKAAHSLERVSTTEVHLSRKVPLRVVERPLDKIIGDHLWHGSIILAHAILQGAQAIPKAETIIELGAGCGLVSLSIEQALGNTSKAVIATDLPEVVATTLEETLGAHASDKSIIRSEPLEWGNEADARGLLAKVQDRQGLWILAADVLYNPSSHAPFLQTLCDLCADFQQRTVTIAYRPRTTGDDAFFDLASNRGFPFTMMLEVANVQIWQHSNIGP